MKIIQIQACVDPQGGPRPYLMGLDDMGVIWCWNWIDREWMNMMTTDIDSGESITRRPKHGKLGQG